MKLFFTSARNIVATIAATMLLGSVVSGQIAMTRSTFTGTYTPIVGGTTSTATGDDNFEQNIPVGFSFTYLGTPYTQFAVSTNGWLSFGTVSSSDAANADLYTTTTPLAVAPWWDDLTTSAIVYQTTGTPGSQVCTIQWTSLSFYTGSTRTINYQVKLYEGTNVIEFWYGAASGTMDSREAASIGLKNGTGGNGQYLDAVTGSAFTGNSTLQADRYPSYNFRFTPGLPTPLPAGTYNVGVGQTYRNLNEAAAEVNHRGVAGAVVFNLVDAQYDATPANGGNMFPVLIGPIAGASAANTTTFTKAGTAAIVAFGGASGSNGQIVNQATTTALSSNVDPIVGLVGADYVTIDNFDIRGNVGNLLSDYGVGVINSSATDGATNNIIQNVSVVMNRANTGSRGFWQSAVTTPSSAAGANSNNTYRNFTIRSVFAGIQFIGNSTNPDVNTVITNTVCTAFNSIGDPATANDIGAGSSQTYGIRMTNQSGFTVSNCSIRNVTASASQTDGIFIETFQGTSTVSNNKIQTIRNSSTSSTTAIAGIRMSHTTTGTHAIRVYNNTISEIISSYTGSATASRTLKGIFVSGTGGATTQSYEIYDNTVSIDGSASLNLSSVCLEISTSSGPVMMVGNNIFSNTTATQTGVARHFGLVSTSATLFGNTGSASNNNDIYVPNDNGTTGFAVLGNATTYATVAAWTTASTHEAASVSVNPAFAGAPSNLHSTALALNGIGMAPPAYLTLDQDCAARTPDNDLGAYIINGCTGVPTAGTITGPVSVCSGAGVTLTLSGASSDAGIVYQWASSATPGGPYTTLLGNGTTQATGNLSATTYYVVGVGCTVSSQTVTTTEFTVTVLALPTVAINPAAASYCVPGGSPVALTGTGASTYSWAPSTGLSATTGTTVNATPAVTTTYTVVGTAANGCTSSGTSVVTVSEVPSVTSITATPASVCSGGSSQLQVNAALTTAYTQTTVPFVPINSGSGTVTLASGGTAVVATTAGSLDDGYWNNQAMPFTFMYFGAAYNSVSIQSNGAVSLAPFTTTTGYNVTMPNTAAPNTLIAACFGDLDWRFGGVISCYTAGTAPNRVFVINYNGSTGGGFYNSGLAPTALTTFQVQLFEGSNIIQVHSTSIPSTGVNHAQGIENAGGTTGVVVAGRNNTTWTATNDAVQFAPSATGTLTYTWTPPAFLNSTTIANPMAVNITATTTYTVNVSNGGCSGTASVTVVAGTPLTATSTVAPASTVCAGTVVTLGGTPVGGGSPYTYAWTGPNSFSSSVQNPSLGATTPAMSGTYTLVVSDGCAASYTTTVALTVNALPSVSVTPSTATFCSGGPGIALSASGASTYAWGPAAGLSATTGSNVTASPTVTTTYTVSGTDGNGCVGTASAAITSASGVVGATATATPAAICAGSSVNLTSTSNGIPTVLLTENFNAGAPAWTRTNTSTGGTPANAAWTDRPDGYVYAFGTPYHSNDNTQFVQTNSDAQGSGSTARTTLESPVFSTLGANTVTVNFYQYYRDINDNGDSAVVEASLDGINWTIITAYTANSGSENAFSNQTVTLPGAFDNQPTVYVRFRFIATWDWYWSIDNVTIGANSSAGITFAWASSPAGFTASTQNTSDAPTVNTMYTVTMTTAAGCTATASTASVTVNALPTVTASTTASAVCAGDQVTFNGGGATSYTWTGGVTDNVPFTPTVTDTYTVTGTDANGCTNTATAAVTVNALPVVTASSTASAVCDGDQVTLNGGGATSYVWTGSVTDNVAFTPTVTDTYTVTGTDANGCTNTASVMVTVNALPVVTASSTASVVCDGDQVTLNGGGATSYVWTGSVTDNVAFTPTVTDTYTVTGTDANGCTNTASVMVTVNALPVVTASASASAICAGDSVNVTGGGASTYVWTGGVMDGVDFAPSVTDTYTVTGTDANGCSNTANIMITVNALPVVTLSLPLDTICTNFGSVALSGETPAGGTWSGPGVSGSSIDPVAAGVGNHAIMYMYTDANGCSASAIDSVVVDVCNGIDENQIGGAVVFPNPNNGDFTLIPSGSGVVDVYVYSATGQLVVAEQMPCGQQNKISLAASGMYSVVIVTADGHKTTQRVIVNR